jgi:peptidoglycan/LPS O-acetylase OafA/YrhL
MAKLVMADMTWLKSAISRDNNFDLIRLFAALQVVVLHSTGHMNVPVPSWFFNVLDYAPGVPIFFFLSGMLVTSSLSSSSSLQAFYMKRVRRVFPALWVSFGLGVLLLITFGQLAAPELRLPAFWLWVVTQISFLQFYNPEFFRHFGTGVVNGSLWTISVEVGFYLVLPLIVSAGGRVRSSASNPRLRLEGVLIPMIVLSYALFVYLVRLGNLNSSGPKAPVWVLLINQTFVPHLWLFGLGILAYLRYDFLKARLTRGWLLLAVYLVLSFAGMRLEITTSPIYYLAARLLLCATVFSLGAHSRPVARKLLRGWDLSYGLYVFHMLVVNTFIALGLQGSWTNVFSIIAISISIAALSWRFVEGPSIRMREPLFGILWKRGDTRETVAW